VSLLPIWNLPDYFALLENYGAQRVVALSSTSRFVKGESPELWESRQAKLIGVGEQSLQDWAEASGKYWLVFRPTLVYGLGRDKNVSEIARFIQQFGFFPIFAGARGKRQPVHAEDVASVCVAALLSSTAMNRAYSISGGEILTYHEMVRRVFAALGRRPYLLRVPLWTFRLALSALSYFPRYGQWSATMAERMNCDLVFDHAEVARDFGFKPRDFVLTRTDLPG